MTKTNQKIPEGWSVKRLGEIFFKSQTKNIEAKNIPVLTNSAVKGVIPQNEYFDREIISEENLCNYYYVECGDFIYNPRISKTAPAGPIKRNHFTKPGCVSPLYTVFKIASNVSEEFYENYFESNLWAYEAYKVANYGARSDRMNITDRDFFNIKLPFPPLAEQEKIAEILSCWDEGIEKLSALIEKKKIQKKALMQQLLTAKIRLPGFTDPWNVKKLGEIGTFVSGGTPDTEKPEYWNGNIVWLTPSEITKLKTRFVSDSERKITKLGLKNSSAVLLPKNSLIICTRATIGDCCINTKEVSTNQGFKNLIPNNNCTDFLYYLISIHKRDLIRRACGSTFLEISKHDIEKLKYVFPPLAEQEKIADILSKADEEIELLNKKREAFKLEKKGLMQKLLTGQIRVKVN